MYEIPGKLFEVPTAYVWIFTARLVTGKGLPPMAKEWAIGAGVLFAATTIARIAMAGRPWRSAIPGGIAVAVGKFEPAFRPPFSHFMSLLFAPLLSIPQL